MSLSQKEMKALFGAFSYADDPRVRGAIRIESAWVRANIVRIETPLGKFPCHRRVAEQISAFIHEGFAERLITDIGGIWVPRHILWDPARPLSGHAYGCDIDINVDDGKDGPGGAMNYGANSYQPARLIELAGEHGFEWGGVWRRNRDGMHFSYVRPAVNVQRPQSTAASLPQLRRGMAGPDVKELQRRLVARGYRLAVDGVFGPKTAAALVDWQKKCGFKASGRSDLQTWRSLGRDMAHTP